MGRYLGNRKSMMTMSRSGPMLFPFTTFTFLPCCNYWTNSSTQGVGPTLAQMQTQYAGQPWLSGYFTMGTYQGYQRWTVPGTGNYTIEAGGAAGGDGYGSFDSSSYAYSSGQSIAGRAYGALISGTFALTAGDVIEMVVGIEGGRSGGAHGNENGGGGATWVYNVTKSTLLLVAGGGGGAPSITYGTGCTRNLAQGHGQSTTSPGNTNGCSGAGYSITLASGGVGGYTTGSYQGGAGGGYTGAGASGGTHCSAAVGGGSYSNGLVGGAGNSCYNTYNFGGFGGGGGGMLGTPGAGGGYNGGSTAGAWSSYSDYGGGGGSYNAGTAQTNTAGGNGDRAPGGGRIGAGYCKITKL